jgi:hypothetical protein
MWKCNQGHRDTQGDVNQVAMRGSDDDDTTEAVVNVVVDEAVVDDETQGMWSLWPRQVGNVKRMKISERGKKVLLGVDQLAHVGHAWG